MWTRLSVPLHDGLARLDQENARQLFKVIA
jgi:hypothetical protein